VKRESVREFIDRLTKAAGGLPDGLDSGIEVAICDGRDLQFIDRVDVSTWTTVPENGPLDSYVLVRPHVHPGQSPGPRAWGAAAHADEELRRLTDSDGDLSAAPGEAPMWHSLFVPQIPVLEKILRTVLVYATILILFRVVGKRDLAAFNTFDFVVIFLLSNVVQNAIIGSDNSLLGGVIGAVTLVAVNSIVNRLLAGSDRAARIVEGTATTIIEDGRFLVHALRRLSLRPEEVEHAIRMQNGDGVSEVAEGRMEPTGQLIVTLKPEDQSASKGDIAHLNARLDAIEAALAVLTSTR
jgi:uncharacterized membrane protein YcaP (DUF421 family)